MAPLRWTALIALVLVVMSLAACGGDGGATETGKGPVRVATSISVFADMVRRVGGDRVTVISLIPPGADAHTYQPSPKTVKKLGAVRAVFVNGAHLEESLAGVLENNVPRQAKLVELSQGMRAIDFEQEPVGPEPKAGENEEEEPGGNPHFWLDVQNAKTYVQRIHDTLAEVDPDGRSAYAAGTDRYLNDLDGLDREIKDKIGTIPPNQRKLVTFHDAFPYFARAYGLDLVGYVVRAPGRDPSARDIKDLEDKLRQQKVKTVFKEPQLNAKLLERAAKDAGVKVDVLYSDALTGDIKSYVEMMRRNADNIVKGLK